jgi:hypothetical protein
MSPHVEEEGEELRTRLRELQLRFLNRQVHALLLRQEADR